MALHSTYPQAIWCHIGGECEIKSTCNINDFRNFRRPFGCVPHRSIAYKYDSLDDHPYTTTSNITRYCRVCDDDRVEARSHFNPSPPGQIGRHFTDDVFKCIFMNEKLRILIKILLKIVPKCLIDNNPTLDQTMACRRTGEAEGLGVGVGVAGGWWVVGELNSHPSVHPYPEWFEKIYVIRWWRHMSAMASQVTGNTIIC